MTDETISSRDLCAYIGDDSKESLDRIQQWVGRGLFDQAGCEAERYIGRGRVRRYPGAAKYWAAAIRRLFDRGFTTRDIVDVIGPVTIHCVEHPGFVERTAAEGRPVWLSYIRAPAPHGLDHGGWTIANDAPSIPAEWGTWKGVIRSVDLGWLFSSGHS